MKILNPDITTNILKVLPRSFNALASALVIITEDGTRVTESVVPNSIYTEANYSVFECDFTILNEGKSYFFEITLDGVTVYRDKGFATAITVEDHSINEGEFVIDTNDDSTEYKSYD